MFLLRLLIEAHASECDEIIIILTKESANADKNIVIKWNAIENIRYQ